MTRFSALHALAERHGVLTGYEDTSHTWRPTDPDVLTAVLRALGIEIDAPEDAERLLTDESDVMGLLPPVLVVEPDIDLAIRLNRAPEGPAGWQLRSDDGTEAAHGDISTTGACALPRLPVGFWDLEVDDRRERAHCRLLVAPPRAARPPHLERTWGAFVPLYSVRDGDRSGHLGDVRRLAGIIEPHAGRVVAVLPLLATFLGDDPFEYSPYQPVSRRYFSELYLDPDRLPVTPSPELPVAPLDGQGLVDYRALQRRADALVAHVRDRLDHEPVAREAFEHHRRADGDLDAYAHFRAEVEAGSGADADQARIEHHQLSQWLVHHQLTELRDTLDERGQALALDLPIGCHADGYDIHRRPGLYAAASAGAPPDDFFRGGQDWGFPPPHPVATRADGHREFTAAVEALARYAGVVRIDHILGLNRLWWVPRGGRADEGAYVRYPLEELLAVLRIVSHLTGSVIVGENLGTVPPEVTEAMARSGILGMHEEQFVIGDPPEGQLPQVDRDTVTGLNTHDMAPFAGFWEGIDLEDHVALGFSDADDLPEARRARHDAIARYRALVADELGHDVGAGRVDLYLAAIERLARSDAAEVMVDVEDLWGETAPQNVPGTHTERPNWRRPLAHELDALLHPAATTAHAAFDLLDAHRGNATNGGST